MTRISHEVLLECDASSHRFSTEWVPPKSLCAEISFRHELRFPLKQGTRELPREFPNSLITDLYQIMVSDAASDVAVV
jgi:hypothetical protein